MITRPRSQKKKKFHHRGAVPEAGNKWFALYSVLEHAKNYPKPDILKTKSSLQ